MRILSDILPLGLAIAASPITIIPAILVLFTPKPLAAGWAFLGGWIVPIFGIALICVGLAGVVEAHEGARPAMAWVRIVAGVLLVALGARQWLNRNASKELPGWMRSIEQLAPSGAFRMALLLATLNPKVALISIAAGFSIAGAGLGNGAIAGALAIFTAAAASTAALPVLSYQVMGEPALDPLRSLKQWLEDNNAAVMAAVLLIIGALLFIKGIQGLS